jgi:predicted nucleic acid-binding protein
MQDIVLDTNILSEFLAQYFQHRQKKDHFTAYYIETTKLLNYRVVREIRKTINSYHNTGMYRIAASTFAFLEISRKFEEISGNQYSIEQFSGFIDQPPEWFLVAPVDESLFLDLLRIPPYVTMPGGQLKNIEWADAIHLATALSRENCLLATTDSRLKQLSNFQKLII